MNELYELSEVDKIEPALLIIMGVSGSGKTTVAQMLHDKLGWDYQEGDSLHSLDNVRKMAAGIPLTDEDRAPWLKLCHQWLRDHYRAGKGGILTCSALKRSYREILRRGLHDRLHFIYLRVPFVVLENRVKRRVGHYMPASLVVSQVQTLEEPTSDEHIVTINADNPVIVTVEHVLKGLRRLGIKIS